MLLLAWRRRAVGVVMVLAVGVMASPARAVEADRFAPAIGAGGVHDLEGAAVEGSLRLRSALWLRVAGPTLYGERVGGDGGEVALADTSLRMDATLAVDLAERVTVGVGLPVALARSGVDAAGQAFDGSAVGDVRLLVKVMAWAAADGSVVVGVALPVTVPSGDPGRWMGADGATVTPSVLLDLRLEPVDVRVNVGYRAAPAESVWGEGVGDALRLGVGVLHVIAETPVDLGFSVAGETGYTGPSSAFEAHADAGWQVSECLSLRAGVGMALGSGIGAAPVRGLLGVVHRCPEAGAAARGVEVAPPVPVGPADRDGDGLEDGRDGCPDAPEDFDGFEDTDGCPEHDNDKDGVNDGEDRCPMAAEDRDGFEDGDGCPDGDNDGDGIADGDDRCPLVAETVNGIDDGDGCPEQVVTSSGRAEVVGGFVMLSEKIGFVEGGAALTPAGEALVGEVAALLRQRSDLGRVEVGGHTGSGGSEAANQALSARRAEAVVAALVAAGVAPGRLVAVGYGESLPIESNRTEAGRLANARIEFRLLGP
ncbi:MAG: OmpA family protein [Myxococcales bacterium]|nr:OmpA family protein [Myxococcales bacterium]